MPSSDYNRYLSAINAANDAGNVELLRKIKSELMLKYEIGDSDVDHLINLFRYHV